MSGDRTAQMNEENTQNASLASKLKGLWPFALIVAVLAFAMSQGWHNLLTLESIQANIGWVDEQIAANFILVFLVYMLVYAACTAFMIPASFLTIAGGAIFGFAFSFNLFGLSIGVPLYGALATVIGATLGACVLFLIAKTSLGKTLQKIAGPFVEKMEAEFNASPLSYMFTLRLMPLFPFSVVNIAPAILGAKFRDYLFTTFFGIIPGTFAYSWVGAGAAGVIRDPNISTADASAVISSLGANMFPALLFLGAVSLIPALIKKFSKKNAAVQAEE